MVKTHSKAQCVLSLVPLPKIDELSAMLNRSTICSSLDCTLGYHHIVVTLGAQKNEHVEVPLSLSIAKLIVMPNDETSCRGIVKLINEKKFASPKGYFVYDEKLLNKEMREDNKTFHALVVSQALIKCILHQAHDGLDHNGNARTYKHV